MLVQFHCKPDDKVRPIRKNGMCFLASFKTENVSRQSCRSMLRKTKLTFLTYGYRMAKPLTSPNLRDSIDIYIVWTTGCLSIEPLEPFLIFVAKGGIDCGTEGFNNQQGKVWPSWSQKTWPWEKIPTEQGRYLMCTPAFPRTLSIWWRLAKWWWGHQFQTTKMFFAMAYLLKDSNSNLSFDSFFPWGGDLVVSFYEQRVHQGRWNIGRNDNERGSEGHG